ncbi:hypothetical protein CYCD_26510 [Tenuifilaceae bacterium CYCD]|nr:hypothetical protein CYCD_26510 [Tenuifilaceae bacterium CYCD]
MKSITKYVIFVSIGCLWSLAVKAQEPEKPKVEIKPYGYVAYELLFDTYKSLDSRDGELYFYPLKEQLDKNGKNINERNQLQMLSISTRLGGKISGPNVLGAKMSGMVEADFYATSNDYIYLLRIRHAMINLKWQSSELMMGHYWHPVIVNEVIPSCVSFGGGAPFHSLNRSPQIRYTYYPSEIIRLSATALAQGYHRSTGPTDAQRNSGKPELMAQLTVGNRKTFLIGASAGYKWLTPRLVTSDTIKTDETIGQYLLSAFVMGKIGTTVIKSEVVYGENLTHLQMIGGYGMKKTATVVDDYEYTNLITLSSWLDVQHTAGKIGIGAFIGYSKLYGANDDYTSLEINKVKYFRNDDLNYIYRIAPRITYKEENFTLGLEYMLTAAIYGKDWNSKHEVTSSMDPVYNNRILFMAKYEF